LSGIVGIFNLDGRPVSPVTLRRMTDAIKHRGPDGEGFYIDNFIGLGHRSLAIIDSAGNGHHPMVNDKNEVAITFKGKIYNFLELRRKLEELGYQFHSKTDSEVVLQAYQEWGANCVSLLNGMFAFAIWDRRLQRLLLARDRYGIKPLYYAFFGDCFLFASEQKAILTHPSAAKRIDLEAVLEYFTFQNLFTDKTFFKDIHLFPPATWGTVDLGQKKQTMTLNGFWDYEFVEPYRQDREEAYLEELERLFRQAVKRQLVGDVEIGAYLSGGLDSGAITAIAAKNLPYLKTFTCGFDLHSASGLEIAFDEREKAEHMSYLFKTEHYEMVLKAGDMERIMPKLVWHIEEPRVGQSYPNFYAAQLASKFVKVVLSGGGGDELFGGYPWRYYRGVNSLSFEDYIDRYYAFWQRLIPNKVIGRLFFPIWEEVKHVKTRDIFKSVYKKWKPLSGAPEYYINLSLYFEAKTFLHGLLIVEDKLSSAHGLESRFPFLDNDLVDFAMQIPISLKIRNLSEVVRLDENEPGPKGTRYFQKTNDGKLLLRRMIMNYIPSEISNSAKQGFSGPDASWFKGESIEYVLRTLTGNKANIFDYIDRSLIRSLIYEHLEGKQNRRLLIWSLLYMENWLETVFKEGRC